LPLKLKIKNMPSLKMGKGYPLNRDTVLAKTSKTIGNYAFGDYILNKKTKKQVFIVKYVGRSDNNLQSEIIQQGIKNKIDNLGNPIYSHFKFHSIASSPKSAFIHECEHFHAHGGSQELHNKILPARPSGYSKDMLPCTKIGCKD
jgi:hypothetical protein